MDKATKETLAFVNRVRSELNLSPLKNLPKGYIKESSFCPVANSIPRHLNPGAYENITLYDSMGNAKRVWEMPEIVKDWVKDFDAGLYPQYEERGY